MRETNKHEYLYKCFLFISVFFLAFLYLAINKYITYIDKTRVKMLHDIETKTRI